MKQIDDIEMGVMKDWRKALRSPPAYRVVNRTFRSQTQFVTVVAVTGLVILIILYMFPKKATMPFNTENGSYNYTYPLTTPIKTNNMHTFRIGGDTTLDNYLMSILLYFIF